MLLLLIYLTPTYSNPTKLSFSHIKCFMTLESGVQQGWNLVYSKGYKKALRTPLSLASRKYSLANGKILFTMAWFILCRDTSSYGEPGNILKDF